MKPINKYQEKFGKKLIGDSFHFHVAYRFESEKENVSAD